MTAVKTVFIVGAGAMGRGIAQVCAQAGWHVLLTDANEDALQQAMDTIEWSVGKLISSGKLSGHKESIVGRVQTVTDLSRAAESDLAIEAVFEDRTLKQEIFRELDEKCKSQTILASNTSAIPITELGAVTERPGQVVGMHFFNPVPLMPVVEVVKGIGTTEETIQWVRQFIRELGKEPIRVETDIPGFLLNRINLVSYIEAIRMVELGIGTVEEIDRGVRLAFGRRMGPFETGDLVGLDVSHGALMAIFEEGKDSRFYPPQLLRRKVRAGHLGRKTRKGWYEYDENGKAKPS